MKKHSTFVVALILGLVMSCSARPMEVEFNLRNGEYCFIFLCELGKPETLLPIKNVSYLTHAFGNRDGRLAIVISENVKEGGLVVKGWLDGFRSCPFTDRWPFSDRPLSRFGFGTRLEAGKVEFNEQKDIRTVSQYFSNPESKRNFVIAMYISKNKESISEKIIIPKGYVNFSWQFLDPFSVWEPFKDKFKDPSME